MSSLVDIIFNIELSLVVGTLTSLILGLLLLLIKVPGTAYYKKIANTKNTIAVCYLICSVLFFATLRYSGISDYDVFSSLMMFVITATASVVLSYSLITLLEPGEFDHDKFYLNVGAVAVMSFILAKSFWWEGGFGKIAVMSVSLFLFIIQCLGHIVKFRKTYRKSVKQLEMYYDEEEDTKIRWIKFCYIIMMLTQTFILVYMLLPRGMMKVYTLFYSLFMLYFSANFISFLGSHKLLLDAFAHKTLSGKELIDMIHERKDMKGKKALKKKSPGFNDAEFKRIEKSLEIWVKEKRYREYDKSREDIAKELRTSKESLHMYFTTVKKIDFRTWRTELRIGEAKKLLLEDKTTSINIIGEMAGFSDRANFYRQFVKIVGCSPKEWRENNGNPGSAS
jgi:AraC-like DNA-binding protein